MLVCGGGGGGLGAGGDESGGDGCGDVGGGFGCGGVGGVGGGFGWCLVIRDVVVEWVKCHIPLQEMCRMACCQVLLCQMGRWTRRM